MKSYGKQFDFYLTEEAENHVLKKLKSTVVHGNGRFAVNLISETIQMQAHRLMSDPAQMINIDHALMIEKEDIEKAFNKITRGE